MNGWKKVKQIRRMELLKEVRREEERGELLFLVPWDEGVRGPFDRSLVCIAYAWILMGLERRKGCLVPDT